MSGWIKLHRKLLDSQMYKNLNSKQRDVMVQVLLLANHEQNTWEWQGEMFNCKPGQFVTSLCSLTSKCSRDVKVQSVRTALLKLEKWCFLTNESTKTGRLITILNWDIYQTDKNETNKQDNKQPTKHQQSSNKALTTNKNDKNDKNDKKTTNGSIFEPLKFRPDFIHKTDWQDIVTHRKKVKSANTERAYKSLINELQKAVNNGFTVEQCVDVMTNRSWKGFDASWMENNNSNSPRATTVHQANQLSMESAAKFLNDEADNEAGLQFSSKSNAIIEHKI